MLNREEYIKRISFLLNSYKEYVISINGLKLFDTNKKAEDFFKDLLAFYEDDFINLKNANEDYPNAESIDLIDEENKLAIQVTSRTDTRKIHNTIEGFYKNYPNLERIIILLIGRSKPNYSKTDFTKNGKYKFDKDRDIIDIQDIIDKFNSFSADKLKYILEFLEKELNYIPIFANSTQEANRDILAEIFKYIFDNYNFEQSNKFQNSKDLTHLKKKIPLNFSKEQEEIVNKLFDDYFKYEYLIREFIEAEQENPFRIDGLLNIIRTEYCEIQGINNPNEKIKDVLVFKKIAEKLTPKKDPEYIFNAQLIVLYFFEQCEIGKKTVEEQKNKQISLFD
ncbi:hypothetical protein SAMN04488516_1173 [Desulfonauticus submarinus]|uniref:SMEK domain-containing protein n=1 Tax=Desulfonauticus submarinus TaxID=206665 RepID=A0A1H0G8F8_9BACT|nr:SMEK domain-containing protein [Desulfonauticus submarinus]SDO03148.1 hypothetical protein SAMN04488516_1173 [Desulfonauticus submarinus]